MHFRWQNGVMAPMHPAKAAETYEAGLVYDLEPRASRSRSSHNHYFACVEEAWKNLPEGLSVDFPSPDHLRRWALVKAGFCMMSNLSLDSHRQAQDVAAVARKLDPYAVISINRGVVRIYTAESQSLKAMGAKRFRESKDQVLHIISELIGTDVTELSNQAKRSA